MLLLLRSERTRALPTNPFLLLVLSNLARPPFPFPRARDRRGRFSSIAGGVSWPRSQEDPRRRPLPPPPSFSVFFAFFATTIWGGNGVRACIERRSERVCALASSLFSHCLSLSLHCAPPARIFYGVAALIASSHFVFVVVRRPDSFGEAPSSLSSPLFNGVV